MIHAMSQQDLLCTPPPQKKQKKTIESGFIFLHMCLVPPNLFPGKKVEFVGDISTRMPKNVVCHHNHSNPISTKLTLFGNIE